MIKKKILSLTAYVLVLGLSLGIIYNVLSFKYGDGILGLQYFYEQGEETVDLLILGSSHAFEDINTAVLYEEHGISSYILAGSIQPFWNSYFYLTEALKVQYPKLVILEAYAAVQDFNYSDHSRIIKNNLGIRDFFTRIESLIVSSPPEKIDNYIFSYRLWHSRYGEIGGSDFKDYYERPMFEYYKGFGINFGTMACVPPDVGSFQGITEINQKEEIYFRKIIELCKQQGIPLMVVVSPYVLSEGHQQKYNYLEEIALEYQVPFLNYNSEEEYSRINLNFSNDMADTSHLNYLGNVKYTNILGEDIQNYMLLDDHRGDERYYSWEMSSKDIHARIADFKVGSANNCSELTDAFDGSVQAMYLYTISNADEICKNMGISKEIEIEDGELYLLDDLLCRQISDGGVCWEYEEELNGKWLIAEDILAVSDSKIIERKQLIFNGRQYIDDQQGIYILLYDDFTKTLIGVKQARINDIGEIELISK